MTARRDEDVGELICENAEAFAEGVLLQADHLAVETDKAIGLPTTSGGDDDLVWLPKSQIEAYTKVDESVIVYVLEWIAEEKDLGRIDGREGADPFL